MAKKIAISIKSLDGIDSMLDPKFGRAYAFLIFDSENGDVTAQFYNDAASAAHGAGTAAAVGLKSNDVDVLISGRFGPKAMEALQAFGIEMWTAREGMSAQEVLERFESGDLERMQVKVY